MTDKTFGSCLCGKVTFAVNGKFEKFFLCHCRHCQKDTGSAHAANLFSSTAEIEWFSGIDRVKTFSLPGTRHIKSFCSECGSALPTTQNEGALLVVPAGCLDSDIQIKPDAHIFETSKANWDQGLEQIPTMNILENAQDN